MNMDAHHEAGPAGGLEELEQVRAFWDRYGTRITIAAAVVAIAIAGVNMVKSRSHRRVLDAAAQLAAARSAQDLEAIVSDYSGTPSAPLALLQLAKAAYDSGNYSQAMTHYETFTQRYAQHELADAAVMGAIHCREARGELAAAEAAFKAFAEAHPKHFLAAQALLGEARCLEQLGRFDEARVIFENMVATRGDSMWGDRAKDALDTLEDRREAYNNPPAVAAPAAAPFMPELVIPNTLAAPAGEPGDSGQ